MTIRERGSAHPIPEGRSAECFQTQRSLLKTRFSVFDGGGDGAAVAEPDMELRSGEHRYHSECYACPVGEAFRNVSQAARSEAIEGLIDALAELVRTGSKLLESIAAWATSAQNRSGDEVIERVCVE
ncbi:MAG: hypothetical protein C4318_02370 [Acidimicrobiia bacterium]